MDGQPIGEGKYMANATCAFCKQDLPEALTWRSEKTGLSYCIDQRIHECLAAWADRAFPKAEVAA